MNQQQQKFNIKIPQNISVIFSEKKKTLTVIGPVATKSIKLKLKININQNKKILTVSPLTFSKLSNAEKKQINALRATTVAQIKHLIIESSTTLFQKLKIVGVGYRIDFTDNAEKKIVNAKTRL